MISALSITSSVFGYRNFRNTAARGRTSGPGARDFRASAQPGPDTRKTAIAALPAPEAGAKIVSPFLLNNPALTQ